MTHYPESANIFLTLHTVSRESHTVKLTPAIRFGQTGSNGIRRRFVVRLIGRLEIFSGGVVSTPRIDIAVERPFLKKNVLSMHDCLLFSLPKLANFSLEVRTHDVAPREEYLAGVVLGPVEIEFSVL